MIKSCYKQNVKVIPKVLAKHQFRFPNKIGTDVCLVSYFFIYNCIILGKTVLFAKQDFIFANQIFCDLQTAFDTVESDILLSH